MSDELNDNLNELQFPKEAHASDVPSANGYFETELNYLRRRRKDMAKDLADIDKTIRLAEELYQQIIVQNGSDYWVWDSERKTLGRYHEFGNLVCWVDYQHKRQVADMQRYEWYFTNSHPLWDTIICTTSDHTKDSLKTVCQRADELLNQYNESKNEKK